MSIALVVAASLAGSGCSVNVGPTVVPNDDDGNAGQGISETVTIVFRNLTEAEAVEVGFHATTDPLEIMPDDLFDPERAYVVVQHIGVGGRGVIAPGEEDIIEHDCAEGLAIGTTGGVFVDNESGDERGTGTPRWIQEGAQFSCGAVVIFQFAQVGDEFSTSLLLGSAGS